MRIAAIICVLNVLLFFMGAFTCSDRILWMWFVTYPVALVAALVIGRKLKRAGKL